MKSGKRHLTDRMELPNKDKIRTLRGKETYKYLGILEADTTKQVEMKEKLKKEYLRRTRMLFEKKLCCRSLIEEINIWVVLLVRYSGLVLKWTREELKQMDQRTRKLTTMHKANAREDADKLYVWKKKEERKTTCQHWKQRWWENLDMAKKRKPYGRNRISPNSSTKWRRK